MKKIISLFLSICLLAGIFILKTEFQAEGLVYSPYSQNLNEPMTADEIRETIADAVSWFKNAQEANGHFRYEYMPFWDRYVDDDNMVRQTGALYVLGEVLKRDADDKYALSDTVVAAISYFEENSAEGAMRGYDFRCILSDNHKCVLGSAGLALVGMIDLIETYPDLEGEYRELLADYLNYILAMKKHGEGFRNYYYLDRSQSGYESSFSNGEAFLALARYYRYNPTEEVKTVIDDVFEYFSTIYSEEPDANFYLWGIAAIKELYELDPREEYYDFVKEYTDWRISPYRVRRHFVSNKCAYIEGIVSAYSILEPNLFSAKEKEFYLEEINFWLKKSKNLQIEEDASFRVRFNRNMFRGLGLKDSERAVGGFLTNIDEPVQRIDFTQHCLSSYLQKLVDIDGESL